MENMTGKRFGKLTVLSFIEAKSYNYWWLCRCDCGAQTRALAGNLKRSKKGTSSCPKCLERPTKHGHSSGKSGTKAGRSKTYSSWLSMHSRVREGHKGNSEKLSYGYAHVSICERWKSFENFLADMGERPKGKTLDRVDNLKGYEPSNCRWATWAEQIANRRERRDHAKKKAQ